MKDVYAYPTCCDRRTTLSVYGWRCDVCDKYLPFRDDDGLTWAERQQHLEMEG